MAEKDQDITWSLRWLDVPPRLEAKRDEVVAALKEALDAYGYGPRRDFYRHVICEF
ncbi:MAG: hypothetical protein H7Z12_07315 [Rhodospirillaceae bacterium]|nr:hypothetical protein [Rhodospirillales bacterium]